MLEIIAVTVLSLYISYTTIRSSYCIVTLQFLYQKTVQLLYCHSRFRITNSVHLLYCHSAVPIVQNGPVAIFSQYNSYTTKRSSYSFFTVQFLYYKTVQCLFCHIAFPILQNGPITVLSHCSSYTTKRSSYCIVIVQFLYHKSVQLLYCHSTVPMLPVKQFPLPFQYKDPLMIPLSAAAASL